MHEAAATPRRSRYVPPARIGLTPIAEAAPYLTAEERAKAPAELFLAGDLRLLLATVRVAVVGSRDATPESQRRAARIARVIVEHGGVVVSGLAKGIDRAAHEATIAAGGKTIAVIGTPVEKAYPAEHGELQELIWREHLLISQFPKGSAYNPSSFPRRNRTMALLTQATVIVQAAEQSGALHQAAECQRLGRDLFIMKSVAEDPALTWPASFIRSGAFVLDEPKALVDRFAKYRAAVKL